MITKEQAMTARTFKQIAEFDGEVKGVFGTVRRVFVSNGKVKPLSKPRTWRASGKCKV